MNPVRYTDYVLKPEGETYRYIGLAEIVRDDGSREDVYLFTPPVSSGFDTPAEGRTRFLICDKKDFTELFFDGPKSFGELTEEAKRRQARETE